MTRHKKHVNQSQDPAIKVPRAKRAAQKGKPPETATREGKEEDSNQTGGERIAEILKKGSTTKKRTRRVSREGVQESRVSRPGIA